VWALRFLCITLTITPLRKLTGWNAGSGFAHGGLFSRFFYGTLHFLTIRSPTDSPAWIFQTASCVEHGQELGASVGADIYNGRSSRSALPRFTDGAAGDYVHGRHDQAVGSQALVPRCTAWSTWSRLLGVVPLLLVVKADVSRSDHLRRHRGYPTRACASTGRSARRHRTQTRGQLRREPHNPPLIEAYLVIKIRPSAAGLNLRS